MKDMWFAGNFCPRGGTCSLDDGELTPTNGPKIRTVVFTDPPDQYYSGTIMQFKDLESFGAASADPRNWIKCEGQLLQISDYQYLYSLMGTSYGGDGRREFEMPDLRSPGVNDYYMNTTGNFIN